MNCYAWRRTSIAKFFIFGLLLTAASSTAYSAINSFHAKDSDLINASGPDYAHRLFQALTGVPIQSQDPKLRQMRRLINRGDKLGAAQIAINDTRFYSVRLRNFAARFGNIDESPQQSFNDLQALVLGITRDDLDARELLTANYRYEGYRFLGLPDVSRSDNRHYLEFDRRNNDYWRDLTKRDVQWDDISEAAGALTTRAWAEAHYQDGTNRRAVKYAMQVFLCSPMTTWRMRGLPDHFVRRDVTRASAGSAKSYQNECRQCHSAMDAMGGAFARLDFVEGEFIHRGPDAISPKMNRNETFYPEGFVTHDDYWINYIARNPIVKLDWRGTLDGYGVKALGEMLANSGGFSSCMVKRAYREVCGEPLENRQLLQNLTENFENDGYRFQKLFGRIAAEDACVPSENNVE